MVKSKMSLQELQEKRNELESTLESIYEEINSIEKAAHEARIKPKMEKAKLLVKKYYNKTKYRTLRLKITHPVIVNVSIYSQFDELEMPSPVFGSHISTSYFDKVISKHPKIQDFIKVNKALKKEIGGDTELLKMFVELYNERELDDEYNG